MNTSKHKKMQLALLKVQLEFMKAIVITCITFIILYTIVQLILSYTIGMELSPTLTTCVYAFFGTELAACALIKIFDMLSGYKSKNKNSRDDQPNYSDG